MKQNKTTLIGGALAMLILILDSRAAANAAAVGLDSCIRTVIPSLLPFFLICGYLTGGIEGCGWIGRIFRSSPNCGTVILTGLLGGYPLGARLAAQQTRAGMIAKAQGDRLLLFCSQAGPSFLFGIAATQMDSPSAGWTLWLIQILSALSVARLFPESPVGMPEKADFRSVPQEDRMLAALKAMASVCGWVIVCNVVISFLDRWFLWLLPEPIQVLLSGFVELTGGCLRLRQIQDSELRFLLAAILLNFGGLCVLMQTRSVAPELNLRNYLLGKCLQTGFSILYAMIFLGHPEALIPLVCVFSLAFAGSLRKKDSIPGKIGV